MTRPAVSPRALAVARGDAPADLLLTGGRVFVPPTGEWIDTALAIADGAVVGWGPRDAIEAVDVGGAALTPGFIDAHMHLESTKLWVDEFVRSVLPWGTTAVAADPLRWRLPYPLRSLYVLVEMTHKGLFGGMFLSMTSVVHSDLAARAPAWSRSTLPFSTLLFAR